MSQILDVFLHLDKRCLEFLVVGLDLVHVRFKNFLEYAGEEFLVKTINPVLYLLNCAGNFPQHAFEANLDGPNVLKNLRLNLVLMHMVDNQLFLHLVNHS